MAAVMKYGGMKKRNGGTIMMFGDDMTQAPVHHTAPHACHAPVGHDVLYALMNSSLMNSNLPASMEELVVT